jgi:hypothetical protein
MAGFGRMHEKGRCTGRGQGGGNLVTDMTGFADAGHDQVALAVEDAFWQASMRESSSRPARSLMARASVSALRQPLQVNVRVDFHGRGFINSARPQGTTVY